MRTGSVRNSWIRFSTETTRSSLALFAAVLFLPYVVSADIRIYEFVYDAPGSDDKHEWIELINDGQTSVDISKWKVNDGSRHVLNAPPKNGSTGTTTLQPGTFVILADDASAFSAVYPSIGVSIIDTSINLPNAGGVISLMDVSGKVVDSVTYSESRGAGGNGNSLQKNVSGKWIEANPTPGATNAAVAVPIAKKSPELPPKKEKVVITKRTTQKTLPKSRNEVRTSPKGSDDSLPPVADVATDSPEVAAVADATPDSVSPWFLGTLGVAAVAAVAGIASMRSKKEEWEIIEETD